MTEIAKSLGYFCVYITLQGDHSSPDPLYQAISGISDPLYQASQPKLCIKTKFRLCGYSVMNAWFYIDFLRYQIGVLFTLITVIALPG